jgi:hypothetical protein
MQNKKSVIVRVFQFGFTGLAITFMSWYSIVWLLHVPGNTAVVLRNILLIIQGLLMITVSVSLSLTARAIYLQLYMSSVLLLAVIPLYVFLTLAVQYPSVQTWGFLLLISGFTGWISYKKGLAHLKKFEYRLPETGKYNPETGIWDVLKNYPGDPEKEMNVLRIALTMAGTYILIQGSRILGAMVPSIGIILIFLAVIFFLLIFIYVFGIGLAICRLIRDIELRDGVIVKV